MLFNNYMKPLGVIRSLGVKWQQCADDTQLFVSVPSEQGETAEVLGSCLEAVMGWR